MIKELAISFTDLLLKKGAIEEERKPIYVYGCELLFSTGFAAITIIGLGILSGYVIEACLFLLFFMPIRTMASGYHAKSHESCYSLAVLTAFLCVAISEMVPDKGIYLAFMSTLFFSAEGYIFIAAPYRSKRNKLKEETYRRNKRYLHWIQFAEIICVSVFIWSGQIQFVYVAAITTGVVAYMIIIARREGE